MRVASFMRAFTHMHLSPRRRLLDSRRAVRNFVLVLFVLAYSSYVYSFKFGVTDRTLKGSTPGCTCHGSLPSPAVVVTITGPDTLAPGASASYTLSVSGGPALAAGTNIAAFAGELDVITLDLQKSGEELTHSAPVVFKGSTVSFMFSYTAPLAEGTDTIYGNGNSVDESETFGGDAWNYAPNKLVHIASPAVPGGIDDTVKKGWNIVSLPLGVTQSSKDSVFPFTTTSAYAFAGAYVTRESLAVGEGYWLKFDTSRIIHISGTSILSDTIPLAAGWNLIGSISVPVSALVTEPPGLITSSIFAYDAGYAPVSSIAPGRGYWAKAEGPGVLILDGEPAAESTPINLPKRSGWNVLSVTDRIGRTQKLFFGPSGRLDPRETRSYELPPAPARGAFDVRFASQRMLETAGADAPRRVPLSISGADYPVRIEWTTSDVSVPFAIETDGRAVPLTGSGSLTMDSADPNFRLRSGGAPASAFALHQNYPNPFNPSTEIRFEVGERAAVKIAVFNALGELVATVADDMFSPGRHAETFDASGLPSGIYFVRLTSESRQGEGQFHAGQKIVLLK